MIDICLKFSPVQIEQPSPGGNAQPVFVHSRHCEVVRLRTGCCAETVWRRHVKAGLLLAPKQGKIRPHRHDHRDVVLQHLLDFLPHAGPCKTPACREGHMILSEKALHPAHHHQSVDACIGNHWKEASPHIQNASVIEREGEHLFFFQTAEGKRHKPHVIATQVQQGIRGRNDPAAAALHHGVSGVLLSAAISIMIVYMDGDIGMAQREHIDHRQRLYRIQKPRSMTISQTEKAALIARLFQQSVHLARTFLRCA